MTGVWALAALWLGLALVASLLSIWFRVSTALSEIVVGTISQLIIGAVIGQAVLGTDESWVKFLSGVGAIVLTFLAGAELDPAVFKLKWKEAAAVGLASFFFPFLGCAAAAYYVLGWEPMPSWLAGVAMSTTSVAVVYAVMLEFGFNRTGVWKDSSRRMFHHRPRDGRGARSNFCAVHVQDPRVSYRRCGRIFHSPLAHAALFQVVRKPTPGARNQVPAIVPVRNGSTCKLGRQ
jgi:hypothetical protein